MSQIREVSKIRTYLLQFIYLATALSVGFQAWMEIIVSEQIWDPIYGVAYSVWASYALLMLIGVRFPLKMLPLILLQFVYKLVWITGIYYPLYRIGENNEVAFGLFRSWLFAVVVELFIIPWPYVYKHYLKDIFKLKTA